MTLLSYRKTAETARNSGSFAVFSLVRSSATEDFRGERDLTSCKFPAKTAKQREIAIMGLSGRWKSGLACGESRHCIPNYMSQVVEIHTSYCFYFINLLSRRDGRRGERRRSAPRLARGVARHPCRPAGRSLRPSRAASRARSALQGGRGAAR